MQCPYCSSNDTKVIDSRETDGSTRRRRECLKCGNRFTTYERVEDIQFMVIKKDGRREQFNREKIKTGITKACEKRPISMEKIEQVVDKIEADLRRMGKTEIKSRVIGKMVVRELKHLDKVAYIRFASVYQEFDDLESFENELRKLKKK
ncbi:MAG: transcriptional regulator NrdR [Candidatus Aenigmarchaeota archaeon ex4484_14]|nr:MAG: transcriptional regulator NrdR [Candidatus Aenigmarchaeota archaeon ex4484_14]